MFKWLTYSRLNSVTQRVKVFVLFAFYLKSFDKSLTSPFVCSQYPQDVLSVESDLFCREYSSYAEEKIDLQKTEITKGLAFLNSLREKVNKYCTCDLRGRRVLMYRNTEGCYWAIVGLWFGYVTAVDKCFRLSSCHDIQAFSIQCFFYKFKHFLGCLYLLRILKNKWNMT